MPFVLLVATGFSRLPYSLFPVHGGPELGIEEFGVEFYVGADFGVLFGGDDFVVDHGD